MDKLLERFNVKYEDLTTSERETLHNWLDVLARKELTFANIAEYLQSMIESVELELAKTDNGNKKDIFLKARLRNYILLKGFMQTPEKAKKALEMQLAGLSKK